MIRARHYSAGSNVPPTRVVIHATCPDIGYPRASAAGQARATARYFQSSAAGGSAHYVCDIAETIQCLPDDVIAWHAPPNPRSLGIEICADGGSAGSYRRHPEHRYSREQWLSPQVWPAVVRAAALTRELCRRHGIPIVRLSAADVRAGRRGICGHVDVSNAFHQSDHDDPGPDFPWDRFMALVREETPHPKPEKPAPINLDDDKESDMRGCYYKKDRRTVIYLVFDSRSGFWHEFSNGAGRGPLSGGYVNPIAKNWDTGSWPQVTEAHARVLKAHLDLVRKGK